MSNKLSFLSRRALLYHREHSSIIQPNTRTEAMLKLYQKLKKLTNIEEENLIKKNKVKFGDTSNLKGNLISSVEMLGCSRVKSVGSRDKIVYGKRKLAEICDVAKGET